jgi:hypothetical protein
METTDFILDTRTGFRGNEGEKEREKEEMMLCITGHIRKDGHTVLIHRFWKLHSKNPTKSFSPPNRDT